MDVGFYTENVFFSIEDAATEYRVGINAPPISYNKWYFAVFNVNRATQFATADLYNVQMGSPISIASLGTLSNANPFTIGQGSYQKWVWRIQRNHRERPDIQRFALGERDAGALCRGNWRRAPEPAEPSGRWPLNGDSNDYSGNGNKLFPTGSVFFTTSWTNGYTPT